MSAKNTKKIFLPFAFILMFNLILGQTTSNFGTPTDKPPAPLQQQFSVDGFHPPVNRKNYRRIKKIIRHSLTRKQKRALKAYETSKEDIDKKYKNPLVRAYKKTDLWITRQLAKRKEKKIQKMQTKFEANKSIVERFKASGYKPFAALPTPEEKYPLTPTQQNILEKYQNDSTSLKPSEMRIYRKVKRILKKREKYKKKITPVYLNPEDSALLVKYQTDRKSLTDSEKTIVKTRLLKVAKHNKKQKKIQKKAACIAGNMAGYYVTDVCSFKDRVKKIFKRLLSKKKTQSQIASDQTRQNPRKMSPYYRKLHKLNQKYQLTQEEKLALTMAKNSLANMSPREKYIAYRAAKKEQLYKEKVKKLQKKEFLKFQPPEVRKRMKKQEREIKKRDKKRYRKLKRTQRKSKIRKIFKRKK